MKIFWRCLIMFAFLFLLYNPSSGKTFPFTVHSPDSANQIHFSLSGDTLAYSVTYHDKALIHRSPVNFVINGSDILWGSFSPTEVNEQFIDHSWRPVWGERSVIPDTYNQIDFTLKSNDRTRPHIRIQARAYNEGVAFRYIFISQSKGDSLTLEEKTLFNFTGNYTTYPVSRPQAIYTGPVVLDSVNYPVEHPMTVVIDENRYLAITEAFMDNYSRMKIAPETPDQYRFISQLAGPVTTGADSLHTPWRVFITGRSAGDLIENNYLLYNLNPPSKIEDTSWITPGKAIRIATPFTTERAMAYVDFAKAHGLDYVHFDTGWYGSEFSPDADPKSVAQGMVRKYPFRDDSLLVDVDMQEVIEYADMQDIGVILYVNHVGLENYDLGEVFAVYNDWGISGVKFGFVNVGPQRWTNWLHNAVRTAAEHHLIVDIHDQYRPTGFSRTYPNLLTQEGIGGDEEWPGPEHELILPFTRFIAGAADHTFTFYSPQMKKTHAFQLSAPIVYFSPLQYLFWYDSPDEYDGNPGLKLWEALPTTWDETQVIQGEIGEYITVARRKGTEWFVGTLNDSTNRDLKISLRFLPESEEYTAQIFTDHPRGSLVNYPVPVNITKKQVNRQTTLSVRMIPGGGHAIRLVPLE